MFDKSERGFFSGNDVNAVVSRLQHALQRSEVPIQQTAPAIWSGKSYRASWSIAPKVTITAAPTPRGFMLDVRVSADIEAGGAIGMVVCWFFCFPLAIILAVFAHQEYTRRQQELFQSMLSEIRHLMIEPNFPPPFGGLPPYRP